MKKSLLLLATMVLCFSTFTWAQDTAEVTGTVTDSTGAVIPNAKITVSNPDKAFVRNLVSDTTGIYTAARIPIGNYVVTAEAAGFQKLVRSGITLSVGQIQRVDLQMTVGQVTQEVTVTGNVPQVETETAAISDVVTGSQIANLELNGRNFVTLALLVPGASPDNGLDTAHVGVYGNNNISFNGSRMQYNNWEIDGGNNTDEGSAGTFNTYPNLDTIAEFRISTSNYGADMGKHAGATIEVATKAGTRTFHGDAFEYVRNDKFDSNPWFINQGGGPNGGNAPKTPRKWNDYGYTFGGPFYIPGVYNTDKSKTFFYWSQDWRKYREGQVLGPAGVPSCAERGLAPDCKTPSGMANFTDCATIGCSIPTVNGVATPIIGPATPGYNAAAFQNAMDMLNGLVPLPNEGASSWILASNSSTNWRQEQIRVDQNVSDKTTVFVRYTHDAWNTLAIPSLWSWSSFDTVKTPFDGPGTTAVLHITHSFKPNLMNEFVMGWTQDHILLSNQPGSSCISGTCAINRPANFAMNHFFTANGANQLLPGIVVGGGGYSFGEDASNHPWFNSNPIVTWKDNLAWTRGNHTLKFGVFIENYRKNEQFGANTQGYATFETWGNSVSTGNALADMFLGRFNSYSEGTQTFNGVPVGGYPKGHWRMGDYEPYIQDDWKVNSHLTLNIGVRYYYLTRIHDMSNPTVDSGFLPNLYNPAKEDPYNAAGTLVQTPGLSNYTAFGNGLVECGHNGIPLGCQLNNNGKNWAPRFGFAWDPWGNGKTVIRGGYGVYYEMGNGNEAQAEGGEGNPPVALSPSISHFSGYGTIQPVFNGGVYTAPLGPTGYTAWPSSQPWGSEQQFSFGVQHQFSGSNLFSVGYVGMQGRHLARARSLTQPLVGLGTVNVPALVGNPNADPNCDVNGNCNAQQVMINGTEPRTLFQPYPGYSGITMKENSAISNYNALQMDFRHTFGHGLTLQTAYTWAKTMDDSTSTYLSSPNGYNDYDLKRFYGTSDLNRTQVLQINYIYDLPFFKNAGNSIVRQGLGGWEVSGITSFFTGEPIDFGCGFQNLSTGVGGGVRCNSVAPVKVNKTTVNTPGFGPMVSWYNASNIVQPQASQLLANNQPGMFGYMGRNFLTGPGRNNTDFALLKNFNLPWFRGEHSTMQFRWETYNTFNHPQWNGIEGGCNNSSSGPGRTCTGLNTNSGDGRTYGTVNSAWAPRIMQLGLKLIF